MEVAINIVIKEPDVVSLRGLQEGIPYSGQKQSNC